MQKLDMQSKDRVQDNIQKIRTLFPSAVKEVKRGGKVSLAVDFDVLRQEMSSSLIEGNEERYQFTWPDKRKAILLANTPINATLRPAVEESENFDTTQNLYIEGDNLEVLKLLQETYLGGVKVIYIDPPYNTGNDFVYRDDFAQDAEQYKAGSGQYDEEGNRLVENVESNGRFHTDWLNMIYPRLKIAKDLLTDDGIIFISIDDKEVANLIKICDEIFGEKKRAGIIHRRKNRKPHNAGNTMSLSYEFIVAYYKDKTFKLSQDYAPMKSDEKGEYTTYPIIKSDKKRRTYVIKAGTRCDCPVIEAKIYKSGRNKNLEVEYLDKSQVLAGKIISDGRVTARFCLTDENGKFSEAMKQGNIFINVHGIPKEKRYRTEEDSKIDNHHWDIEKGKNEDADEEIKELFGIEGINALFEYPKPVALIEKILTSIKDSDCICLDFFSGSATTAHAVMEQNAIDGGKRKFILVQLPEINELSEEAYKAGYKNICEIGKERIRRAGKKIKEESPLTTQHLDTGFRVLKLDSSNMKDVYYSADEYKQVSLLDYADNIKEDRTSLDLLFQVMLQLGHSLSAKIEEKMIANKQVFVVDDDDIIACFAADVDEEVITEIAKMHPLYAVFRDSSMQSDSARVNFEQIFAAYSPATDRRVI